MAGAFHSFSRPACGPRPRKMPTFQGGWLLLASVAVGCHSMHEPATQATTNPAMAASVPSQTASPEASPFDAPKGNFSAALPAGWKQVNKGGDYVLGLVPEQSSGGGDDPILAVQYPSLPPHIPGLLPIGGVADGYVNDLKKRFSDEKVDERSDVKLDGAEARRIVSSFTKDGKPFRELATLAVHGDHVYVITATCPAAAFDQSKAAFNELNDGWKWKS